VLDLTGAPFDAGLVRFAATLPLLVFYLPAGVIVDRYDRRRVMLATESIRLAAAAVLAAVVALGAATPPFVILVALIIGTGATFFQVAETSAIPRLVPSIQLPTALAQNAARASVGLIAGQTLGGVLYAVGRAVPFVADSVSYLVSFASIVLLRRPLQASVGAGPRGGPMREGLAWLWSDPFLRTTMLLFAANNIVVNSLYVALIVIARALGATSAEIGVMLACIGVGGLAGSVVAMRVATLLPLRTVIVLLLGLKAVLTPVLLFMPNALSLGLVFGAMFFVDATGDAAVGARQLAAIPDRLQGRVNGAIRVVTLGSIPVASLLVGALLQWAGPTATLGLLAALMIATTAAAILSAALRAPPPLAPARA
jgi:MFS family permease